MENRMQKKIEKDMKATDNDIAEGIFCYSRQQMAASRQAEVYPFLYARFLNIKGELQQNHRGIQHQGVCKPLKPALPRLPDHPL